MATFIHTAYTAHDPETGLVGAATVTSYVGEAIQFSGNAAEVVQFRDAGMTLEQAVVLGWTPGTYAESSLPPVGSVITWGPDTLTLRAYLKVVAPDAVPIYARLWCVK